MEEKILQSLLQTAEIVMDNTSLYTRRKMAEMFCRDITTIKRWEKEGLIKPVMYVKGRPMYSLESFQSVTAEPTKQQ